MPMFPSPPWRGPHTPPGSPRKSIDSAGRLSVDSVGRLSRRDTSSSLSSSTSGRCRGSSSSSKGGSISSSSSCGKQRTLIGGSSSSSLSSSPSTSSSSDEEDDGQTGESERQLHNTQTSCDAVSYRSTSPLFGTPRGPEKKPGTASKSSVSSDSHLYPSSCKSLTCTVGGIDPKGKDVHIINNNHLSGGEVLVHPGLPGGSPFSLLTSKHHPTTILVASHKSFSGLQADHGLLTKAQQNHVGNKNNVLPDMTKSTHQPVVSGYLSPPQPTPRPGYLPVGPSSITSAAPSEHGPHSSHTHPTATVIHTHPTATLTHTHPTTTVTSTSSGYVSHGPKLQSVPSTGCAVYISHSACSTGTALSYISHSPGSQLGSPPGYVSHSPSSQLSPKVASPFSGYISRSPSSQLSPQLASPSPGYISHSSTSHQPVCLPQKSPTKSAPQFRSNLTSASSRTKRGGSAWGSAGVSANRPGHASAYPAGYSRDAPQTSSTASQRPHHTPTAPRHQSPYYQHRMDGHARYEAAHGKSSMPVRWPHNAPMAPGPGYYPHGTTPPYGWQLYPGGLPLSSAGLGHH